MAPEENALPERRKASFENFYNELIPTLVEFVGQLGINPSHEVIKNAVQFAPLLDTALMNIAVEDEQDKILLLTRVGYFIGEYFVQKYAGCWYVNEIRGSRYFGRYVVGQFAHLSNAALMLDPFQIAQIYVETKIPRQLEKLLLEVNVELVGLEK